MLHEGATQLHGHVNIAGAIFAISHRRTPTRSAFDNDAKQLIRHIRSYDKLN